MALVTVKALANYLQVEAKDYQLWLNGLNPLEEDESYLRDLTIAEIGCLCFVETLLDTGQKYTDDSVDGAVLLELLKGIKNGIFNTALDVLGSATKKPLFWGLRRHQNRAVWVKRLPTLKEMMGNLSIVDPRQFK